MLTETVVDGDRHLILANAEVRVAINADYGAHLYELTDRRSGVNLLYEDAKGSRGYRVGGWYELFPNAGSACALEGREISKHGDIQRRPWRYQVRISTSELVEIDLVAESDELPFRVEKTLRFTASVPGVEVREEITNVADRAWPYLWGQHITFGERFMTSARIHLPDVEVYAMDEDRGDTAYAPGAKGRLHALPGRDGTPVDASTLPDKGSSMMLFSEPLSEHSYQLWSADLGVGVSVAWDGSAFPVMWVWGTNHASAGPGVVACALEPQSCEMPTLAAAVEAGRAPVLAAGASRSAWATATLQYFV